MAYQQGGGYAGDNGRSLHNLPQGGVGITRVRASGENITDQASSKPTVAHPLTTAMKMRHNAHF